MNIKKNKKKLILKILLCLLILGLMIVIFLTIKVKNIYVIGNTLLSDQEILEQTNLLDYPNLYKVNSRELENKIKLIPYIEKVNVRKNIFGRVDIEISEYKMLLKNEIDNSIYLSNLKSIPLGSEVFEIPSLTNYVDEDILKEFLKELNNIDLDVLNKISEVTYAPSKYDKDLFLFNMTDGNYVYITTKRLEYINEYTDILMKLNGKKGIMYLDSGNHFKILE